MTAVRSSIPRIRNVRLKNAPNVHVLVPEPRDPVRDLIVQHGVALSQFAKEGEINGWLFMVWDAEGNHDMGFSFDKEGGVIGADLAPSFVADAFRRAILREEYSGGPHAGA